MTIKQLRLLAWVKAMHGDQKRKYTGEPYCVHLVAVGKMAEDHGVYMGMEIGLCHDLLEDTPVTFNQLFYKLEKLGYNYEQCIHISIGVFSLTDHYTKENFPHLNRKKRKQLESERLWCIPTYAQTVKYCDTIDNLSTIVERDPGFARVYIKEKNYMLVAMDRGNKDLFHKCKNIKLNETEKTTIES